MCLQSQLQYVVQKENRSNFTAGAVTVEANLPGTFVSCEFLYTFIRKTGFTFKMKIRITEYYIRKGPIRWQILTSIKVIPEHFSLALTGFEISRFKIRDIENVGQGHDIQHS